MQASRASRTAILAGLALAVVVEGSRRARAADRRAGEARAAALEGRLSVLQRSLGELQQSLAIVEDRLDHRDDELAAELRQANEELTRTIVSLHAHVTGWPPVDA